MSRTAARIVLAIAVALLAGGVLWWALSGRLLHAPGTTASGPGAAPGEKVVLSADLYFPADGEALGVERRRIETSSVPKDQVRAIVQALLDGPRQGGLVRPLPAEVTLGGVVLTADPTYGGTAYVDLRWADHADPPAGGSTAEMQCVYSLVNSIALNVPQAPRVVLLWNGQQRPSFAGHLDTGAPLTPLRELIVR